jgi:glycosyltransferase involved in cell wall biosynthesis
MRILLICYDSPFNIYYGAGMRANNLWRALQQMGDVSALVMEAGAQTELDLTPHEGEIGRIRFQKPSVPWTTPETQKIRALVAQVAGPKQFDLVVVRYLRLAMLVRGSLPAPLWLDGDDLDKVIPLIGKSWWQRQLAGLKTWARRVVTRRELQGFEHVWYVNPHDMLKFPTPSGSVLPNVVNAPDEPPKRLRLRHTQMLMVGKFGYEPNAEAADFFIHEVLPTLRGAVPGIGLRLVGQCPEPLAARWRQLGIDVAGFVDDLTAEYAGATLVVAPVLSGGGTQIKVLEALAYTCGTVVSSFSASGFAPNLKDGEHFLVAHTAQEWVAQCMRLIQTPSLCEELGHAGRDAVLQHYSLSGMTDEVRRTMNKLKKRPAP